MHGEVRVPEGKGKVAMDTGGSGNQDLRIPARGAGDLPTLPAPAVQILRMAGGPEVTTRGLRQVVPHGEAPTNGSN